MILDDLKRIRALYIAYHTCNNDKFSKIPNENFEKRSEILLLEYRKCCKNFANTVCENITSYKNLNDNEKSLIVSELRQPLDKLIIELELLYCEIGLEMGFSMALELEQQSSPDNNRRTDV